MVRHIDVDVLQLELPRKPSTHFLRHALGHLEEDLAGKPARLEFVGDPANDTPRLANRSRLSSRVMNASVDSGMIAVRVFFFAFMADGF